LKKRALLIAALGFLASAAGAADPWAPWRFLVGHWEAAGGGAGAQGQGSFAFELRPGTGTLVRRNHAEYPAQNGQPASSHDDLMVISPDGAGWRATFVDEEGHVIVYTSITLQDNPFRAVFLSDPAAPGPRYRLTYEADGPDAVKGSFAVGAQVYRQWRGVRK